MENIAAVDEVVSTVTPVLGGGELLNMGLSIVVVIGAILLLGWFYSKSRFLKSSGAEIINVIATRALGPKERLLIIEVAEQQLLIGMTATAVQTLHVFEKPLAIPAAENEQPGFAARLRSTMQELRK
jgi:flagellar protein FliO/FliZ